MQESHTFTVKITVSTLGNTGHPKEQIADALEDEFETHLFRVGSSNRVANYTVDECKVVRTYPEMRSRSE